MKFLRGLVWTVLVLAVLAALAIGVALMPSVQRWAVKKALAGRPGVTFDVGAVSVGLRQARVSQLSWAQPGLALTVSDIRVDFSLWDALVRRRLLLHDVEIAGARVDLRNPAAAEDETISFPEPSAPAGSAASTPVPPAAVAAFNGFLNNLRLPVEVTLDRCALDGDVILSAGPARSPLHAHVTLSGGNLGAGREGKFDYDLTLASDDQRASVRSLAAKGTLAVALGARWQVDHLVLATTADARGPRFPQGARLQALVSLAKTPTGESYAVVVNSLGEVAAKQLLNVRADYLTGSTTVAGIWSLEMGREDVLPFTLGWPLPQFNAAGEGKFTAEPAVGALSVQGRLSLDAGELGARWPQLKALGHVHAGGTFDVAYRDRAARVERLELTFAGDRPAAVLRAAQPFEFDFGSGELRVADAAKELFVITLPGVPLAWLQPFLGGLEVRGDDVQGEFVATARDNGFTLRPERPLRLAHLTVLRAGQPLVNELSVDLSPSVSYWPQGWQAEAGALTVRAGDTTLLTLDAKLGQQHGVDRDMVMTGDFTANLPALLAQPAAAALNFLQTGRVAGDFQASLGVRRQIELNARATQLADRAGAALPDVTLGLRADLGADGSVTLRAPLTIIRPGANSDATLTARLLPQPGGYDVNARLDSTRLAVDDLKVFAGAFSGGNTGTASPPAGAGATPVSAPAAGTLPPKDAKPAWAGLTGRIGLDLKTLTYGDHWQAANVHGLLNLTPDRAWIEKAGAQFGPAATLTLDGDLRFAATNADPYGLTAKVVLANFNPAPLFSAMDPGKPLPVDGAFDITSDLQGRGRTLADLAARTHGAFLLTSKGGKFRALAESKTAKTTAAVTGLLGAFTRSKELTALSQLTAELQEFPYDQLSLQVTRDPSLNFRLQDFSLISPEIRLVGQGAVTWVAGRSILTQPLSLQLQMSVHGNTETLLSSLGKLAGDKDSLGYTRLQRPFTIGGTLEAPDTSDLHAWLAQIAVSGVEKAADRLFDLFGRKKETPAPATAPAAQPPANPPPATQSSPFPFPLPGGL